MSVDHGKGSEYSRERAVWDSLSKVSRVITDELDLGNFWTFVIKNDFGSSLSPVHQDIDWMLYKVNCIASATFAISDLSSNSVGALIGFGSDSLCVLTEEIRA